MLRSTPALLLRASTSVIPRGGRSGLLAHARHCSQGAAAVQPKSVVVEVPAEAAGDETKAADEDMLVSSATTVATSVALA